MNTIFKYLFLFFSFFIELVFSKQKFDIEINEICTKNIIFKDSYGNYSDWIELFNSGEKKLDISGYGLSDDINNLFKFIFPKDTIIDSDKYLLIFASKENSTDNEIHTGFSLKKEGEILIFSSKEGEIIEKIEIPFLEYDETFGKFNGTLQKMIPTPREKNKIYIESPSFSKNSGFYDNEFNLLLLSSNDSQIIYTVDGSNPVKSNTSKIYKEPILIYDRSEEPNIYSQYENDENSPFCITRGVNYKKPIYLVDKSMVVRAITKNEFGYSKIVEKVYFITTKDLAQYQDLTVVSLITNPENFFGADRGIYVIGNQFIEWKNSDEYKPDKNVWDLDNKCNYFMRGEEWEREVQVSIFEKGEIFLEQKLGIRIKGSSTRNAASKSFNLIARKDYGKLSIKIRLFPDNYDKFGKLIEEYKSFSLRQVGSETRLKDKFTTDLFHKRNLTTSEMRPCVVFLNGEYWGMYIISEQFTNEYVESHYGIPKNDVAMIKQYNIEEGPESEYKDFMSFAYKYSNKDLTIDENYMEVFNQVDFESLYEHYAAGIYTGITDWPGYNFGLWRNMGKKIEGNEFSDGKWRLITYDLDKTLLNSSNDDWMHMQMRSSGTPAKLFITLLQNKEFKKNFVKIFSDYANGIMSIDKVKLLIEKYKDECTDLVSYSQLRWKSYDGPKLEGYAHYKKQYLTTLDTIYKFFEERKDYTLNHMKKYLNLTGDFHEITINKIGKGNIKINTIFTNNDEKWIGKYISDYPVIITAFPSEGYIFKGWTGDIISNEDKIEITLDKDIKIRGNFLKSL